MTPEPTGPVGSAPLTETMLDRMRAIASFGVVADESSGDAVARPAFRRPL
jgi:hypothetical protein